MSERKISLSHPTSVFRFQSQLKNILLQQLVLNNGINLKLHIKAQNNVTTTTSKESPTRLYFFKLGLKLLSFKDDEASPVCRLMQTESIRRNVRLVSCDNRRVKTDRKLKKSLCGVDDEPSYLTSDSEKQTKTGAMTPPLSVLCFRLKVPFVFSCLCRSFSLQQADAQKTNRSISPETFRSGSTNVVKSEKLRLSHFNSTHPVPPGTQTSS